mgnify:CR=1 FL=1
MDVETSLRVLSIMSDALTTPQTLRDALDNIINLTIQLMETQQTAILLRDEERAVFIVKANAGFSSDRVRAGHPLQVPERLQRILWNMRTLRQIGYIEAGIEELGFPMLVIPLRVKGNRIGLLITGKPVAGGGRFSEVRRRLFVLIASFASLVIENAKVYDYLRQQFAQRSWDLATANKKEAGENDEAHHLMVTSLKNPTKVVRLLAGSFYKELARAGFSPDQITMAAAEILDCITRQEYSE